MLKHRSKLVACGILLAGFHVGVFLAGFLAPYGYATQNREMAYMPPSRLHLVDTQGKVHLRPFVYGWRDDGSGSGALQVDSTQSYPLHFFAEGSPYMVAGLVHSRIHLFGVAEPGRIFLLGTDGFGRDQFSRFLYGGQVSLLAGLIAAALSVSLGILVGVLAGFYGGWIDEALMRCGELFLALPWLYLLFAVRAAMPLHITQWQVFLLLVSAMGLIGWARPARLVRGIVLSAKERNFVVAARGFGASNSYLIRRHVMPQASGVALTQVTLLIPQYVLAEVTLTFLGLGVSEPMPSWGSLLSALQQYYVLSSYWWMFLPAALLIPLFLAYYLAADALQEHWKPVSL
jgi:peptide/nickel transport system permease protein